MKRLALLSVVTLALAACSPTSSDDEARYVLEIQDVEGDRIQKTLDATERVVERVVESMDQQISRKRMRKDGKDPVLYVTLKDPQATPVLTEILTSGFRFRLMKEVPKQSAEVTATLNQGEIGFSQTGITEEDLSWVEVQSVRTTDSVGTSKEAGQITIELTPAGQERFKQVQKENSNRMLGIYVRDRLVSTMRVAPDQQSSSIVISNVPSVEIANVFADDVNVGLHVTFQPQGAALPAAATGSTASAQSASTSLSSNTSSR